MHQCIFSQWQNAFAHTLKMHQRTKSAHKQGCRAFWQAKKNPPDDGFI
jgi:hypothetical protein